MCRPGSTRRGRSLWQCMDRRQPCIQAAAAAQGPRRWTGAAAEAAQGGKVGEQTAKSGIIDARRCGHHRREAVRCTTTQGVRAHRTQPQRGTRGHVGGNGGGCVNRDTAAVPTGPPQSGGWEHVASAQHGGAMGSLEPHLFPVGEHPPPATVSAVATPTTAVNTARSSGVIVSLRFDLTYQACLRRAG